jgi:hypothetical protein
MIPRGPGRILPSDFPRSPFSANAEYLLGSEYNNTTAIKECSVLNENQSPSKSLVLMLGQGDSKLTRCIDQILPW